MPERAMPKSETPTPTATPVSGSSMLSEAFSGGWLSGAARRAQRALVIASVLPLFGCLHEMVADPEPGSAGAGAGEAKGAVIVGAVDWQEVNTLPEGSAERHNSRAVAYLSLPATGKRCTGFLIAPDVLMTNQHCVTTAAAAQGARAYFRREAGATGPDAGFDCSTFLGNDAGLDMALLSCAGAPGDTYGVLELAARTMAQGAPIYVIHQNCDYYSQPSCSPTKKLSPGRVTATRGEISYDADTLGGSSGSPLFSRTTHEVVGLHHVGVGGDGTGRGSANRAVPMTAILPVLAARYPGVALGARAPVGQRDHDPGPALSEPDGYEPNDTRAGAVQVGLPFTSVDARIEARAAPGDVDHFAFVSDGGHRTLRLSFQHAAGDLDLYLFDASGRLLGRSVGTTDREELAGAVAAGVITVRVVGYGGATGPYTLEIR
jgi:V8-like Glu-specific endopeptidase